MDWLRKDSKNEFNREYKNINTQSDASEVLGKYRYIVQRHKNSASYIRTLVNLHGGDCSMARITVNCITVLVLYDALFGHSFLLYLISRMCLLDKYFNVASLFARKNTHKLLCLRKNDVSCSVAKLLHETEVTDDAFTFLCPSYIHLRVLVNNLSN